MREMAEVDADDGELSARPGVDHRDDRAPFCRICSQARQVEELVSENWQAAE
jgi:hypothetical protein